MTPEAGQAIRRARQAFVFSIALLIIGLLAVGGALIYRAGQPSGKAAVGSDYVISALKLPKDAQIVSAVAADGRLTVTYKSGAMTSVRIVDGKTGDLIREIPVISE